MGEPKEKICRLCLNFEDDDFTKLDASVIGKVKAVVPELILSFPNDSIVCSKCRDVVERSFELKRTFSKNNELIQNEKNKSNSNTVDLNSIVDNSKGETICRICLQTADDKCVYIDKDTNVELSNMLDYCVPELDETLTLKPAVCSSCEGLLIEMYNFKKDWLAIEDKIQSSANCVSDKGIDLNKVLMLNRSEEENDFLSGFEVKDEDETDIFDAIPNNPVEQNGKRPNPDNKEGESPQAKRQKFMEEEITDEELPQFIFTPGQLFNPNSTDIMLEDWLAKVEEYKQKFNWSDYTTIHKVLVKLKDMKELYIWFSNIADIMDWNQWKTKLERAFPRKTDYFVRVKKMMFRKKRKDETYVSYYHSKLKVMEPLNLTAEEQISCIFGGIIDVLVSCVGRVGDYKSPEELLDYFKSCDDKQSVEAAAEINKEPRPKQSKLKAKNQMRPPGTPKTKETIKCVDCKRLGHTVAECRKYKIGEHLERMEKLHPQHGPNVSDAKARKIKKNKAAGNQSCFVCGKMGHLAVHCRFNKNVVPFKPGPAKKNGSVATETGPELESWELLWNQSIENNSQESSSQGASTPIHMLKFPSGTLENEAEGIQSRVAPPPPPTNLENPAHKKQNRSGAAKKRARKVKLVSQESPLLGGPAQGGSGVSFATITASGASENKVEGSQSTVTSVNLEKPARKRRNRLRAERRKAMFGSIFQGPAQEGSGVSFTTTDSQRAYEARETPSSEQQIPMETHFAAYNRAVNSALRDVLATGLFQLQGSPLNSNDRCAVCQKKGHAAANCWSLKPKPNPLQNQARQNKNTGQYIGAYGSGQDEFNRQICLRCYKTGHLTNDCQEFARKFYRNQ